MSIFPWSETNRRVQGGIALGKAEVSNPLTQLRQKLTLFKSYVINCVYSYSI